MATLTLSQAKDEVKTLGQNVFHDTRGHNTLSAEISGSDLSHAWLEFRKNSSDSFEAMKSWGETEFAQPITEAADGVALSGISIREAIDVRYETDSQDILRLVYSEEKNGTQRIMVAESAGNPESFGNEQTAIEESDKAEDPNWLYHRPSDTLHLYYEDNTGHGEVAVWEADTLAGTSYSNKSVIGGDKWDLGVLFASPHAWMYNGSVFVGGEEHDTNDRDLFIAKGTAPTVFNDYKIVAEVQDYSHIDGHINIQDVYISKDGTAHGYSNIETSNGYTSVRMSTSTFEDDYPVNWDISSDESGNNLGAILRLFNDIYVYGVEGGNIGTEISYWHLEAGREEISLMSDGGSIEFGFCEPSVPPGTTIEWRVAVEDTSGNVERSETLPFEIVEPEYTYRWQSKSSGDFSSNSEWSMSVQ